MNKAVLLGFLLAPIMAIAGESSSVASEGSPQTVIAPEQTAEPAENVEATANATAVPSPDGGGPRPRSSSRGT